MRIFPISPPSLGIYTKTQRINLPEPGETCSVLNTARPVLPTRACELCETANRARSELPLTEARRAGGIVGNVIRSRQPRRRRWRGVPSRAGPRGERSTMRA